MKGISEFGLINNKLLDGKVFDQLLKVWPSITLLLEFDICTLSALMHFMVPLACRSRLYISIFVND